MINFLDKYGVPVNEYWDEYLLHVIGYPIEPICEIPGLTTPFITRY